MIALPVPARIKSAMGRFYRDRGQAFFRALDKDPLVAGGRSGRIREASLLSNFCMNGRRC
jgi:hypothetical protein